MFEPLLTASIQIQLHMIGAVLAIVIGPFVLFRKKRDLIHKIMGYTWVLAMLLTAVSSFFIYSIRIIGPFGPIHLLAMVSIIALIKGVGFARSGNLSAHRKTMRSLYFWALGVAGLFTLFPGRIMNKVIFSDHGTIGFAAVLACLATVVLVRWLRVRQNSQG